MFGKTQALEDRIVQLEQEKYANLIIATVYEYLGEGFTEDKFEKMMREMK